MSGSETQEKGSLDYELKKSTSIVRRGNRFKSELIKGITKNGHKYIR